MNQSHLLTKMINVGIIGATGYTAEELIAILLKHPLVKISCIVSSSSPGKSLSEVYPKFKNKLELRFSKYDLKEISSKCDCVFLALPHTVSMGFVPGLLKEGKRVIDLSADYRIKDLTTYSKHYEVKHKDKDNVALAVYGLPELYRNKIKSAKLVANPGCYPTAAILALAPLVSLGLLEPDSLIIDAKSGVSGAGKKVKEAFLFTEIDEDFKAYKVNNHQHIPEIEQELSKFSGKKIKVTFVPHLLPLNRGILETIYVTKSKKQNTGDLVKLFNKFYKSEPFIRIKKEGDFPRLTDVVGTNFCDIGIKHDGNRIIIISAIDNLLKGASGQAVQNMNIMYGLPEVSAL